MHNYFQFIKYISSILVWDIAVYFKNLSTSYIYSNWFSLTPPLTTSSGKQKASKK